LTSKLMLAKIILVNYLWKSGKILSYGSAGMTYIINVSE